MARAPVALTISASDSSGVSGIAADIKTFSALGAYAAAALTRVAASDTQQEHAAVTLQPAFVAQQVDAVLGDIGADVVKTGLLADAAIIREVTACLKRWQPPNVVVDASIVSRDSARRLDDEAVAALRDELLPLATVLTANVEEAALLSRRTLTSWEDIRDAAKGLTGLGAAGVVITGGRREGEVVTDLIFDGADWRELATERIAADAFQGLGDTFSAALAATLAKGETLPQSVAAAKAYVTRALQEAYALGRGRGPVHHFYRYWRPLLP